VSCASLPGTGRVVESADAHLKLSNGAWTYRYYTRTKNSNQDSQCENDTGRVDPLNVINYQYGEASRMFTHYKDETHWDTWSPVPASDQVICTTTNGTAYGQQGQIGHQNGHFGGFKGCCIPCPDCQSHFRMFPAGHLHDATSAKFSVMDVHREDFQNFQHAIMADWEDQENHIVGEMDDLHNVYPDYYDRVGPGDFRGFFDNGDPTRVGGLH
jgi:hypothetical protein